MKVETTSIGGKIYFLEPHEDLTGIFKQLAGEYLNTCSPPANEDDTESFVAVIIQNGIVNNLWCYFNVLRYRQDSGPNIYKYNKEVEIEPWSYFLLPEGTEDILDWLEFELDND